MKNKSIHTFDSSLAANERLPKNFIASFEEIKNEKRPQVKVSINNVQIGEAINEN